MSATVADNKLMMLIRQVQARKKQNPPVATKNWKEIFGTMPDDEAAKEAARLGEEWRRSEGRSE
jgi:hypothetical protein